MNVNVEKRIQELKEQRGEIWSAKFSAYDFFDLDPLEWQIFAARKQMFEEERQLELDAIDAEIAALRQ